MDIHVKVRSDKARQAFAAAPAVMERHLDQALGRGALEIAREAGRRVHKAFSTLWASIRAVQVLKLHWRVSTGTNYARAVEEGSKPGYLPNPVHLMGWIKLRGGIRFGMTRQGSAARQAQYDDLRDRAWALARSIEKRGTRAHPFMKPAAEVLTPRVHVLADQAVDAANREIFGA